MDTPTEHHWPPLAEEFILPYLRVPALWPVAFAILGHVVLVFTLAMLSVWRAPGLKNGIGLDCGRAFSRAPAGRAQGSTSTSNRPASGAARASWAAG